MKRCNAHGPDGLTDRRQGDGARFELNPLPQAERFAALQKPPADGGLWSGPKVAAFVRDRFGPAIVQPTGWQ